VTGEDVPDQPSSEWLSYLMPGTRVVRTIPELTDAVAVAVFERVVSADAEVTLRRTADRPQTLDLAHLNDIHERLFADVYPFAGHLRYVDTQKPGQTGEPFLHHRWIETYTTAVVDQLRAEDNLVGRRDPGQWADHAAYYWAAVLHAHPYREGNGRSVRLWMEDLAAAAGQQLDWSRSAAARNNLVADAAANGDYEPMRALLTAVAGGTVGVDRDIMALDDLYTLQHGLAWTRVGLVFGDDQDRQRLIGQIEELRDRINVVHGYLGEHPDRLTTSIEPATDRWRGLASSVDPAMTASPDWPKYAAALDTAAGAGLDVAAELPAILANGRGAAVDPTQLDRRTNTSGPSPCAPRAAPPVPTSGHPREAATHRPPHPVPPPSRGR
jgi:cell filamentation protein